MCKSEGMKLIPAVMETTGGFSKELSTPIHHAAKRAPQRPSLDTSFTCKSRYKYFAQKLLVAVLQTMAEEAREKVKQAKQLSHLQQ